jgi:hypothetical protein
MLDVVRLQFGSDDSIQPGTVRSSAPQGRDSSDAGYDPDLIAELNLAQVDLMRRFHLVTAAHKAGDFARCLSILERFDASLRAYSHKEGVQFDEYMRLSLREQPEAIHLMCRLRSRLDELASYVHEMVEMHRLGQLQYRGFVRLGQELERLGEAFDQCLQAQAERLFPLYRPLERRRSERGYSYAA